MDRWIWALVAVIGILLVVAIVLMVNRQRRSMTLQQRFGPEYARTVDSAEDRRAAEAALEERARRRSKLTIVPLAEPVRLRYAEQWRGLQEHFVDRPSEAVASAEELVGRVLRDRGYPLGEFDEQADLISVDHPEVVENYRIAHAIHRRNQAGQAGTEELREAMLRYRSLFENLLHPGQALPDDGPDAADARGDSDARIAGRQTDTHPADARPADGRPADGTSNARDDGYRPDARSRGGLSHERLGREHR